MDPIIGGSLITAGSSLLGGLMGQSSANKANKNQMDLAKNTIKYRTEDAKRSGIHPLYALGAPTMSTSHVTNPMGQAVANAGNAMGQAIAKKSNDTLAQAQLENVKAQTRLTNAQTVATLPKLAPQTPNKTPTEDPLKIAGGTLSKNTGWSDAEKIEERYGDIASWLYGLGVVGADAKQNFQEYWNSMSMSERANLGRWNKTKKPYAKGNTRKSYKKTNSWGKTPSHKSYNNTLRKSLGL